VDYSILAAEMLEKMLSLRKAKPQRSMDEAMQGEAFVLHYIASHGGEVLPGEIGSKMNVSSARIAQALNSIEKKGFITREIDTNDRRKIIVKLTPEGKSEAKKHYEKVIGHMTEMLAALGENDAKEYVRITGRLAETAQERNRA